MRLLFLSKLFSLCRLFLSKDEKGSVAVIFVILLIPILAVSGAAVDYSTVLVVREEMQTAADTAALAAIKADKDDDEKMQEIAEEVFNDNLNADRLIDSVEILATRIEGGIRVDVTSSVNTMFLKLVGIDEFQISVVSEVIDSTVNIEVVMVLDNTFSMFGSKMDDLKGAATLLVDKLFSVDATESIRVGLVPFAQVVNIGMSNRNEPGIDVPADYSVPRPDYCRNTYPDSTRSCDREREYYSCTVDGVETTCSRWRYFNCTGDRGDPVWVCTPRAYNFRWFGNMGSRDYPLNVRDDSYNSDEIPALMTRWNSYWATRPLTRLTSDETVIRRAISRMRTAQNNNYSTYIPVGLIWGWRLLSNEIPFTDASPYDGGNKKVMVLLTDGANTRSTGIGGYNWMLNQGALPAEENAWHYGSDVDDADEKTLELCENIKDEDIVVYTIAFDVTDVDIRATMATCAGNGGRYFDASDADELEDAFEQIAEDLSALRISR